MYNIRAYSVKEVMPALNAIAKVYSLELNRVSDFKIARAIWANTLREIPGIW
tara:strand:+ start:766 stop:921 length:156 start_codon:yes stop_codon:yes gene_type:complete